MKLLELIQVTANYFQKQGIDSPRLNAEQLIAFGLGIKRLDLYLQFDREIAAASLEKLRGLVKRRANREPLQHILGAVDFCGYSFKSDARALIPRPETEGLVELALKKADKEEGVIWDVGTGSGVIAISFLLKKIGWKGLASDISKEAITLAQENALNLKVQDRLQFFQVDLLELETESVDIIVSNPPYLESNSLKTLSSEVQFDPKVALDGGVAGLFFVQRLIERASFFLKIGGWLILEIGEDQRDIITGISQKSGWLEALVLQDLTSRDRYFVARK